MLKNNASFQLNRGKNDSVDNKVSQPAEKKAFTFSTFGIRKQPREATKEEKKKDSPEKSQGGQPRRYFPFSKQQEEKKVASESESEEIDMQPLAVDDIMSQTIDDDLLSERSSVIERENEMRRKKNTGQQIQQVLTNIQSQTSKRKQFRKEPIKAAPPQAQNNKQQKSKP